MGANKTLLMKKRLAKKQRQNRPLPNWFRYKSDSNIRYNAKRRHWRRTKLKIYWYAYLFKQLSLTINIHHRLFSIIKIWNSPSCLHITPCHTSTDNTSEYLTKHPQKKLRCCRQKDEQDTQSRNCLFVWFDNIYYRWDLKRRSRMMMTPQKSLWGSIAKNVKN